MEKTNVSYEDFISVQGQAVHVKPDPVSPARVVVVMCFSLFFIYVNSVMFFTVRSKQTFSESSRYILFSNILIGDSFHLLGLAVLYLFSVGNLHLISALCNLFIMIPSVTFSISPLNLAVMSMERYVAICFPFQHTEFVTKKRAYLSIAVVWLLSSINFIIDILYKIVVDSNSLTTHITCRRRMLYIAKWQVKLSQMFNGLYFAIISLILVYTYIGIIVAARSVSTDKKSATKAHRTVLLHLIQLGLCLLSFLFSTLNRMIELLQADRALFLHLQFLNFFSLIILPRCLSPLIYGLRDSAFRPLFLGYFKCNLSTVNPVVITDKKRCISMK
ncbi:odorant receptor 131-2-like [Conger conger]|uniref:odorant receptor 131-2-like n=1 Tax=Conger conger TaxID=82655 RepID=UPI002A5A010E|nr:odorant receptor 131-2-like [Conger conger]